MFTRPTPLPANVPVSQQLNIPVVQLDYYTAELIEEYETMREACLDNDLTYSQLAYALRRPKRTGFMQTYELRFMTLADYREMVKTRGY